MYNVQYLRKMKIAFDEKKNLFIQKIRGVSFEQIQKAVREGKVLAIVTHPNQTQYPRQKLLIVNIDNYACVVPFVEQNDMVFLKTAFFSRKYTKKYLKERKKSL